MRRQDAARPACVEIAEIRLLARLAFEQDAGDQKPAQNEKQIDADPQRRFQGVLREHGEHRDGAQAVELHDAAGVRG
jgi:hypothetical protein